MEDQDGLSSFFSDAQERDTIDTLEVSNDTVNWAVFQLARELRLEYPATAGLGRVLLD
jgi:hypothetical protein